MSESTVDTSSQVFAARLASLLRTARRDQGRSVRSIARATGGAASASQLRAMEAGEADLGSVDVGTIVEAYGLELETVLGERVPVEVDTAAGVLRTAGITRTFTPGDQDALLTAYLRLVRELRDIPHEPTVALRRDEVELLARHLKADAVTVLERLGELMGATVTQRRSMVAMFAAGAALIVLSTAATAVQPADHVGSGAGVADGDTTTLPMAADEDLLGGDTVGPLPSESSAAMAGAVDSGAAAPDAATGEAGSGSSGSEVSADGVSEAGDSPDPESATGGASEPEPSPADGGASGSDEEAVDEGVDAPDAADSGSPNDADDGSETSPGGGTSEGSDDGESGDQSESADGSDQGSGDDTPGIGSGPPDGGQEDAQGQDDAPGSEEGSGEGSGPGGEPGEGDGSDGGSGEGTGPGGGSSGEGPGNSGGAGGSGEVGEPGNSGNDQAGGGGEPGGGVPDAPPGRST